MATTEVARPQARLVLPGSGSAEATVEVLYQSRATRISRALLTLGAALLIAPVLAFIPPHFLWPLVALVAGAWLARRYWAGEYYVVHFEGSCPRCDAAIELSSGARIRGRHTLECYGCHRRPELIVEDPEA